MENKLVIVKRSKTGLGLFALADIEKGSRIIQYTGIKIPRDDLARHKGRYLFTLNDKWTIDGRSRENIARYANHSCRPNADTITNSRNIWIIAKKKIKAGEEITYDYGREYFNQFIKPHGCKCAKCSASAEKKSAPGKN